MFFIMNYESPIYYSIKAYESKFYEKRLKLLEKRNEVLSNFYKYKSDIDAEIIMLSNLASQTTTKLTEKSLVDLLFINCICKEARFSFLAVISFNIWSSVSGQVYIFSYRSSVFDKITYDGFGADVNFYGSICAILGTIFTL